MMKKFLRSLIITVLTICIAVLSAVSMGGCSDFAFNPIGKWKLSSDKTYIDGEVYSDHKPGYLLSASKKNEDPKWVYMGDLIYTFTKSGTGIISVYNKDTGDNVEAEDFTYEYNDKEVIIHISNDQIRRDYEEPVEVRYSIEEKDGSIILKNQDKTTVKDTAGKDHSRNDVKILERT